MRKRIILGGILIILSVSILYAADFKVGIGIGGDIGFVSTAFDTNVHEPFKSEMEDSLKDIEMNRSGFKFFLDLTYGNF